MTNICNPDQTYVDYKVSENFWFSELIHSDTADRNHISNYPSKQHEKNLIDSCTNLWQPMRRFLGNVVIVSCAYRSERVNELVGDLALQHISMVMLWILNALVLELLMRSLIS